MVVDGDLPCYKVQNILKAYCLEFNLKQDGEFPLLKPEMRNKKPATPSD